MKRRVLTPDNERCEAKLEPTTWVMKWTDGRCSSRQHYVINGKHLCGRHAAVEALHLAVKGGSCKLIPVTNRERNVGVVTVK